jgi:hypothetical protein
VYCVVKLSACRDHILQGILSFPSIPSFNILSLKFTFHSIGNKGVYLHLFLLELTEGNSFLLEIRIRAFLFNEIQSDIRINTLR